MSPNQVFCDISMHIIFKDAVVFVFFEEYLVVLLVHVSDLILAVGADQAELEGLAVLVNSLSLEIRLELENTVDCLFALDAVGGPLTAHEADET